MGIAAWGRSITARVEGGPLGRYLSVAVWQTLFLFVVDGAASVIDYAFHAYLGRALVPGEFAVVQTMNALFLIVSTAFGVLTPVVARSVAHSRALGEPEAHRSAVFRLYFYQSLALGLILSALAWLIRHQAGGWFNVPPAAIALAALAMLALLLRPVVNGMLQGQERFVRFGLTHAAYAVGRLALALLFVGALGMGALGGVAAMPAGAIAALLAGLAFLGRAVWARTETLDAAASRALLREGWKLSLAAFIAYAVYMSLLNVDVIWTNRALSPDQAGAYAGAAVLRRVMVVLPGAVLTVLFPRVASQIARGLRPDRTLLKAAAAITLSTAALSLAYFTFGPWLVRLFFGDGYESAGDLLGGMALGMIAAGLLAIWLNLFLASRPWPFVVALSLVGALQVALLVTWARTPGAAVAVFALTAWLGALAGAGLYLFWLRPSLGGAEQPA